MIGAQLAILRRQDGTTIVEFALIAPVLCMTLLAFFDFGHRMYVESVVEGVLHEAARAATVGSIDGRDITSADINDFVTGRLSTFSANAEIDIDTVSYGEFGNVKQPEKITDDTEPLGSFNEGDCFEDANGNGDFDTDAGREGLGGAEDVVSYEVTMRYPRIVPLGGFLGFPDIVTIHSAVPVRNQPFAPRTAAAIVCTES